MNDDALVMLEEIGLKLSSPRFHEAMRIVSEKVASGARIEKSFPSVRELKIVLPRRAEAVKREGLGYCGFDELIANVLTLKDDERLLCFFTVNSDYMFAAYFQEAGMSLVGCLHGFKRSSP